MTFPPTPVYPDDIDSDRTLFLVYNTTETTLSKDNEAWAQEIDIVPVGADEEEIWADNGFANLDGELLYYDEVEKDSNGKVKKLKKCIRNIGGEPTKFNRKGTWIRSYVIAEHHNQLATAIIKTEDFIGYNFDPRCETLDWRIRNLAELPVIEDDYNCPDINFTFNIIEEDSVQGILAEYSVEISPPGIINSFRIDFGDGEFTTTELSGTHRYAINSNVDPVLTVGNDLCQLVLTPVERLDPQEPPSQIEEVFDIPVPTIPDFPDFTVVPCEIPEPDINLPPQIFPCLSLVVEGAELFPSVIDGPPINMVSVVTINGPDFPVIITESVVNITGGVDIPSVILIDPPIPPTIIIDPPIPPTIVLVPGGTSLTLGPGIEPQINLDLESGTGTYQTQVQTQEVAAPKNDLDISPELIEELGQEFADLFNAIEKAKVSTQEVQPPQNIEPKDPQGNTVELPPEPAVQPVRTQPPSVPQKIQIVGPEQHIPQFITLDASEIPETIKLECEGKEIPVKLDTSSVEVKISKEDVPTIKIETPAGFPSVISIEHNIPETIKVDVPDSITLEIPENIGIPVIFPEEMPKIEVEYPKEPIKVEITMDDILRGKDQDDDYGQCVMIVPCPRN